jgi:hypothetical protein
LRSNKKKVTIRVDPIVGYQPPLIERKSRENRLDRTIAMEAKTVFPEKSETRKEKSGSQTEPVQQISEMLLLASRHGRFQKDHQNI